MNETLVVALIGAVVVALVAMPLLRGRGRPAASPRRAGPPAVDAPDMPDELAEVELDHAMGRLTDEDYEELRARLAARAEVAAAPAGEAPASSEPARQVAPARDADPGMDIDARAEALVARLRARARATCPDCGERPEPGAHFCSSCGRQLASCPACGTALPAPAARFCPGCGSALGA